MKRQATPGGGPPASRSRVDDDEDSGPTEFDVSFLREQNKQLAASLFGYKRRLQKTDTELNALRSKADGDAAVAQAVLRQWDVLNSDLLDMASAAGVEPPPEEESTAAAPPPSPKRPGRSKKATSSNGKGEERELPMPGPGQLRRAISDGADHHLLVKVLPPASERDVLLAMKAQSADDDDNGEDGDDNEMDEDEKGGSGGSSRRGEEDEARAERLNWVDATTRASCRRSQSLLAALLASPLFTGASEATSSAGSAEAAATQALLKNRALRAEVELLRDRLETGKKQAALDKATALAAQMEARHAHRALDLLRTASSLPAASSSSSSLFVSEAATLDRALSEETAVSTPGGPVRSSSGDSAPLAAAATSSSSAAAAADKTNAEAAAPTPSATGSADALQALATPSSAVKSEGAGGSEDTAGGGGGAAAATKDGEASEDLAVLAATRLRQLEASREEVARLETSLAKALAQAASHEKAANGLANGSGASGANHELATKLQRALAEANRERAAARHERDSSSRYAEDVKRLSDRASAAEARYDEWASTAAQEWSTALAAAQKEHATTSSALKEAQTKLAGLEALEKEASGLREQVADYAKIVAEEQRRQGAARAEAARARQAEKSRAAEAEAARQLAEAATLMNGGSGGGGGSDGTSNGDSSGSSQTSALAAAAERQRDAGQSAELESMKAMNEAMLAELEAMALAADDMSNQNVRLLQLAAERDDVNKLLMTKARQLRDVKGAEAHEREALAHKLQASEQARLALEEVGKARDALLKASEEGRRDRDASMLIRDRDASACMAAGNRAAAELVDAKDAESKALAASKALEGRVAALAEESKRLKATRDALEEQSEASQRKLERALKKLEKAKQRGSSAHLDGHEGGEGGRGGGGADLSEDAEYRELLEFENDNLKKQVMCPLLKEKVKSRILIKCGHAFSEAAIAQCIADRNRKCPACRKAFGADDVKPLFLTS